MIGYELALVERARAAMNLPVTVLGRAGSHADIEKLIASQGIIGAAAGSLFVFKGKYRAVLISYPNRTEKEGILQRAGLHR
jgi:cyclase